MEVTRNTRTWTLVAVCLTTFMLLLDITVVVVALPNMQERFDASLTGLQWVVDAYALTLAALILTAGALADEIPGARLLTLEGAGHGVEPDDWEPIVRAILEHTTGAGRA